MMHSDTVLNESSTDTTSAVGVSSTPTSGDPIKPPTISKGEDVKPPTCHNCGKKVYDNFEKIDGKIICKDCVISIVTNFLRMNE